MRQRCENPGSTQWPHYGGRGITVCARWQDFANFFADMGERPANCTLDRIDNDGPYSPENCRWATQKEQTNNRRRNRMITFGGETKTLQQWAERTGINHSTILMRFKLGWPVERALTTPVR